MAYEEIDKESAAAVGPLLLEMEAAAARIEEVKLAVATEDSKKREAELREESKKLIGRRRELSYAIDAIKTEVFKRLLAEDNGVVGNPKFDKAYSIAYSMGHSSGFSEVENYFCELVELIK